MSSVQIFVVAIFVLLGNSAECLRCYECDSARYGDCADPDDSMLTDCPGGSGKNSSVSCRRMFAEGSGFKLSKASITKKDPNTWTKNDVDEIEFKRLYLSCGSLKTTTANFQLDEETGCVVIKFNNYLRAEYCSCETDRCNPAGARPQMSAILVCACALGALLLGLGGGGRGRPSVGV